MRKLKENGEYDEPNMLSRNISEILPKPAKFVDGAIDAIKGLGDVSVTADILHPPVNTGPSSAAQATDAGFSTGPVDPKLTEIPPGGKWEQTIITRPPEPEPGSAGKSRGDDKKKGSFLERMWDKIFPKKWFDKAYKRLDGAAWGMVEGYVTGSIVGAYNVGRGGWLSVLIADTIGSPAGGIMGAISGSAIGLLSDKETALRTIESYRKISFDRQTHGPWNYNSNVPAFCRTQ